MRLYPQPRVWIPWHLLRRLHAAVRRLPRDTLEQKRRRMMLFATGVDRLASKYGVRYNPATDPHPPVNHEAVYLR